MADKTTVELKPELRSREYQAFVAHCCAICEITKDGPAIDRLVAYRKKLGACGQLTPEHELRLFFCVHVVLDLVSQGWTLRCEDERVTIMSSSSPGEALSKEEIRQGHLLDRDSQLREPAVREFVHAMERRRLGPSGWVSIYSLMRDGSDLQAKLASIAALDGDARSAALEGVISPYLQFAESGQICEHTGLALSDIWRYFRLTWVNAYRSTPGRSMMVLVRDAAAPHHPVIGIASLGSAVVQQTKRDEWIGWERRVGVQRVLKQAPAKVLAFVNDQVEAMLSGVYVRDLKRDGLVSKSNLAKPSEECIKGLFEAAETFLEQHRKNSQKELHKNGLEDGQQIDWQKKSASSLFKSKRCRVLATLLGIRRTFQEAFPADPKEEKLREGLKSGAVRNAIAQVVRLVKAERVGINMMDITVCGALAPYNELLGGKLVSLLLCSPEIVRQYKRRYAEQPSVIASSIKGEAVIREPDLVVLCTTSLYGGGSSQYNRVKVLAEVVGGAAGQFIQYEKLGESKGYGSYHFCGETLHVLGLLLARCQNGLRINSIFGEGVNPLMRKLRQGLDTVGFPSDEILMHGNQRIIYGVPLAKNFREVLCALTSKPSYVLPQSRPRAITDMLAGYWRKRWLDMRIQNSEVLERLGKHTLVFPVQHGAQVPLPSIEDESENLSLWPLS